MLNELVEAVRAKVVAVTRQGDFSPVLDPAALAEAEELRRQAEAAAPGLGGIPGEIVEVLAWFYWARSVAVPGNPDQSEWQIARALFAILYKIDPDRVPPPLRSVVAQPPRSDGSPEADPPGGPREWGAQALALLDQASQADVPGVLDQAIDLLRRSISAAPPASPAVSALGSALVERFQRMGQLADLDEAITLLRSAIRGAMDTGPDRAEFLSNLAAALAIRFGQLRELTDLDDAVEAARDAARSPAADLPARAMYLSNLGVILLSRAELTGQAADLAESVTVGRDAVAATADDDPDLARRQSHLANSLLAQFRQSGQLADLDEAIGLHQNVLAVTTPGHPDRPRRLSSYSRALRSRFERTGDIADLNASIESGSEAVDGTTAGDPERARRLSSLGLSLQARFRLSADPGDGTRALVSFALAAMDEAAPAPERVWAARHWGALAVSRQDMDEALKGYSQAVLLLPLLAWRGLDRTSAEQQLVGQSGLASTAAACAIAAGNPGRAIQLLEHGRSVLWSQMLEMRTDAELAEAAPDLAARIQAVRAMLDDSPLPLAVRTGRQPGQAAGWDNPTDQRMALAREWQLLITQARTFSGFSRYLHPPAPEELRPAPDTAPVVVINVSDIRCDALIIGPEQVRVLPLTQLSLGAANERASRYLRALADFERGPTGIAVRHELEGAITDTLRWLWDTVAEPVLINLGYTAGPGQKGTWPRVWWCPTGALMALPLHAAGYHDPGRGDRTVLDRVISSYTPTLRALRDARVSRSGPAETDRFLIVALAETPGQPPLVNVAREREFLMTMRGADLRTVLDGPQATWEETYRNLKNHSLVHFSCHGDQDLTDPSHGGLLLYDAKLAVGDIARQHAEHAEFAFLSACKTAMGGIALSDEAITVASAIQFAGYRHVIGTLWAVWDSAAADITEMVYADLTRDNQFRTDHAAQALHHAIRRLRDVRPQSPSLWAPFIHTGP